MRGKHKSAEQTGFSMGSLVGIKLYGKNSEALENANLLAEVVKTDERISKIMRAAIYTE